MRLPLILFFILVFTKLPAHQPAKVLLNNIRLKTLAGDKFFLKVCKKKLLALVFLSPDCPLSQNYTAVLNKIASDNKKDIDVIGVFAGKGYADSNLLTFKKKYEIDFLLVKDKKKNLVQAVSATITPQVFLYDAQRTLLYSGAIDDWVVSLGKKRKLAEQHYLQNAINNYLIGNKISPSFTEAIGCFIADQ